MNYFSKWGFVIVAAMLCAVVYPQASFAYDSDEALEKDGALCSQHVARNERRHGIPQNLLGASGGTESGRWHKGLGVAVPWPWTINVEGAPYYFHSKEEAVAAVKAFQAQGKKSIDVGCMQVNLLHHPRAFASLHYAFEPKFNVAYAAEFLRSHYDNAGSWKTAVGRYHSHTQRYADRYIGLVYNKWYGLSDRIAQERPAKRYTSYIQMGDKKVVLQKGGEGAKRQPSSSTAGEGQKHSSSTDGNSRVIRVSNTGGANRYDLALIKPAHAAGKVEAAPAAVSRTETDQGPLVLRAENKKSRKKAGEFVSLNGGAASSSALQDVQSPFIRFVD